MHFCLALHLHWFIRQIQLRNSWAQGTFCTNNKTFLLYPQNFSIKNVTGEKREKKNEALTHCSLSNLDRFFRDADLGAPSCMHMRLTTLFLTRLPHNISQNFIQMQLF